LIALRDRKCNGSNAEFARAIGRDPSYVSRMIYPEGKPGKKRIAEDMVEVIEAAFSLPKGWLDLGDTDINLASLEWNVEYAQTGLKRIPLVSFAQAESMAKSANPLSAAQGSEWIPVNLDLSANSFALRINDGSMSPDFREGDIIIVEPSIEPQPGDYVVAKSGDEAIFRKHRPRSLNERGEQVFELVPINEDYPPLRSDIAAIKVIGTMVEHRRYRKNRE